MEVFGSRASRMVAEVQAEGRESPIHHWYQILPEDRPTAFQKKFAAAFHDALKRLDKEKCANLFGGKGQSLAALNGAFYSLRPINNADGSPNKNIEAATSGVFYVRVARSNRRPSF